jgi:hypothetical protein
VIRESPRESATLRFGISPGFVALKIIALFGSVTFAACGLAAAQGISGEPPFIKHALYLSIESDNPELQNGGPAKATLTVTVRLSDHSRETNFFGDVPATITDFDPVKGSPEQEVWQDASCHHERGYPKMTVIAPNGLIAQDRRSKRSKPNSAGAASRCPKTKS